MRLIDHKPETVVLLGMGPSLVDYMSDGLTQEFTPDFTDEIWSINMTSNIYFSDIIFWMDDLEDQQEFKPGLFEVMRQREERGWPYKVMTTKAYPDIVNSYDYPIQQVSQFSIQAFGKPYFNNGVAMAIAYAMWKGVKRLKIYGADFTYPNRDYAESGRACLESWITLAGSRGMEVIVSKSTSLFDMVADHGVYGYKEQPEISYSHGGQEFKFKYKERAGISGRGVYVAEDTRNDVSGNVPGAEGEVAATAGSPSAGAVPPAPSALGTVEGSGASLRDRDRHGRAEAGHHAGDAASRAVRDISDSGEAPGPAAKGGDRPGRSGKSRPGHLGGADSGRIPSPAARAPKAKSRKAQKGA